MVFRRRRRRGWVKRACFSAHFRSNNASSAQNQNTRKDAQGSITHYTQFENERVMVYYYCAHHHENLSSGDWNIVYLYRHIARIVFSLRSVRPVVLLFVRITV